MARKITLAVLTLLTAVTLGACSSSTGVHTQSPTPTSPSTARATSSTPTSSPSSTWTPPAYGQALPAVTAYLALMKTYSAGLMHPTSFKPSTVAASTAGEGRIVVTQSIAQEKSAGRAYRGTPATHRVTVTSTNFSGAVPLVVLRDCPAPSSSWMEYIVKTGATAPTTKPKVAPPYAATIKMLQPTGKQWVMTSYTLDGSKTCAP